MALWGRWLAVLAAAAVLFPAAAGAHPHHHKGTVRHHHSRHRAHRADVEEDAPPIRVEPDGTEILTERPTTPQDEQEAAETAACCLITEAAEEGL